MWYPSQKRINQLAKKLNGLGGCLPIGQEAIFTYLSEVSVAIHTLAADEKLDQ